MNKILPALLAIMLVLPVSIPAFAAEPSLDSLVKFNEVDTINAAQIAANEYTIDQLMDIYWKTDNDLSKEAIIERIYNSSDKKNAIHILEDISSNDKPEFSQLAYIELYLMGHAESLKGLIDSTNEFGTFRYESVSYPWIIMRAAADHYPDSFLANGIKEYEGITGKPYFMVDMTDPLKWPYYTYGNSSYNPDVEITKLLDFLNRYSSHPAADDAAYRLGRNYEIRGNYPSALKYIYSSAATLPDGDNIEYDAEGRLWYVLDVDMDIENLKSAMDSNVVPQQIKPIIDYTMAVKTARNGEFAEAAGMLGNFMQKYSGQAIFGIDKSEVQGFWDNIKRQGDMYSQLAEYMKSGDNESLYSAASLIYHNTDIFYNNMWNGNRQTFMWVGHINEVLPEEKEAYTKYFLSFNNFGQALSMFEDLKSKDLTPDLMEKTDYSIALCYSHLMDYSYEINSLGLYDEYKGKAVQSFEYFVATYPKSSMADDALYALGHITSNDQYFNRISKEYPDSDMANKK